MLSGKEYFLTPEKITVLSGAGKVGKTYAMEEFAKTVFMDFGMVNQLNQIEITGLDNLFVHGFRTQKTD